MSKRSLFMRICLPIVALAFVAGCSPTPATAIKLNNTTVSEATITRYTNGCQQIVDSAGASAQFDGKLRRVVVSWAGEGTVADQVATQMNVPINNQILEQLRAQVGPKQWAANPDCAAAIDGTLRLEALTMTMNAQKLYSSVQQLVPQVNPRYGVWDSRQMAVAGTGSLSQCSAKSNDLSLCN